MVFSEVRCHRPFASTMSRVQAGGGRSAQPVSRAQTRPLPGPRLCACVTVALVAALAAALGTLCAPPAGLSLESSAFVLIFNMMKQWERVVGVVGPEEDMRAWRAAQDKGITLGATLARTPVIGTFPADQRAPVTRTTTLAGVPCRVHYPREAQGEPLPVVVYLHGVCVCRSSCLCAGLLVFRVFVFENELVEVPHPPLALQARICPSSCLSTW